MEGPGDYDFLPFLVIAVPQGQAKMNHAVNVIPVALIFLPNGTFPVRKDILKQRYVFFNFHERPLIYAAFLTCR